MSNVVDFKPRITALPEVPKEFDTDRFPMTARDAFAAILDHIRAAAAIVAAQTGTDFDAMGELAARLDMETDDDIAVDLVVTLIDWEGEEREFLQ